MTEPHQLPESPLGPELSAALEKLRAQRVRFEEQARTFSAADPELRPAWPASNQPNPMPRRPATGEIDAASFWGSPTGGTEATVSRTQARQVGDQLRAARESIPNPLPPTGSWAEPAWPGTPAPTTYGPLGGPPPTGPSPNPAMANHHWDTDAPNSPPLPVRPTTGPNPSSQFSSVGEPWSGLASGVNPWDQPQVAAFGQGPAAPYPPADQVLAGQPEPQVEPQVEPFGALPVEESWIGPPGVVVSPAPGLPGVDQASSEPLLEWHSSPSPFGKGAAGVGLVGSQAYHEPVFSPSSLPETARAYQNLEPKPLPEPDHDAYPPVASRFDDGFAAHRSAVPAEAAMELPFSPPAGPPPRHAAAEPVSGQFISTGFLADPTAPEAQAVPFELPVAPSPPEEPAAVLARIRAQSAAAAAEGSALLRARQTVPAAPGPTEEAGWGVPSTELNNVDQTEAPDHAPDNDGELAFEPPPEMGEDGQPPWMDGPDAPRGSAPSFFGKRLIWALLSVVALGALATAVLLFVL